MAQDLSPETLARQRRELETLDRLAQRFGRSLSGALSSGASSGRELTGVLDNVGASLAATLGGSLGSAASGALAQGMREAVRALSSAASLGSFGGLVPFGRGGVLAGGRVTPFAEGGVVAAPSYFPMARGLGLMGERGPEAVMPLSRGPDGRLGVRTGGGAATNVTINIAAGDVESFKRSEAQIAAALARAVARGRRGL